jgi:hypothetical protein
MYKTLLFSAGYPEKSISMLASQNKDDFLFLTDNEKTFLQFKEMSYNACFAPNVLTSEDVITANQMCLDFIRSVFFPDGKHLFHYEGFPCGSIAEYYLIPYFMRLFRDILCTVKILDTVQYHEIMVVGTDRYTDTVRTVLQQKGISFQSFYSSKADKIIYLFKRFPSGKKNLWAGTPVRDIFVELIQNALIIGESFWAKLYPKRSDRRADTDPSKKYLIFSADQYTYRIYHALKKNKEWDFLTCGMYYRFRKSLLNDVTSFEGGVSLRMVMKTIKAFAHFRSVWHRLNRDDSFQGQFQIHGIRYWVCIKKLIKYSLLISFPRLFLDYLIAVETFRSHPRSVCIMSDDHVPYYKTIAYAAEQCGVKSIVIQHGILAGINGTNTINADFYAAWGPRAIEWFSTNWDSKAVDKISVTGAPRYDEYTALSGFEKSKILEALKLPRDKKLILVLTAWSGDFSIVSTNMRDLSMIDAVMNALSRLKIEEICQVIIKPHPGGDVDLLRQFLKTKYQTAPYIIEGHLEELFFVSDICVSVYSSCVLEAMFFEKPSVVFDPFSIREVVPFVGKGAALGASNTDEMVTAIQTLFFDTEATKKIIDNQKKYIDYEAYKLDGKATGRVVNLIEKIISGEQAPKFIK